MPIALSDLILFNNVESTDPIVGITTTPFFKDAIYVPNITFVNGFDTYIKGQNGRGSQVLVRKLGKGSVKSVKANAANAFDYSHAETADTLLTVPIDDVISKSEKLYEAVELARASGTGAKKAEVVVGSIMEEVQRKISGYLVASATPALTAGSEDTLTSSTLLAALIDARAKLDVRPDRLIVPLEVETMLLKLITTGDFLQYHGKDTLSTGNIGKILGMEVFVDPHMNYEVGTLAAPKVGHAFVMYNHNYFSVFPALEDFDAVGAIDFKGSYIRGQVLVGNESNLSGFAPTTKGNGSWAVKYVNKAATA